MSIHTEVTRLIRQGRNDNKRPEVVAHAILNLFDREQAAPCSRCDGSGIVYPMSAWGGDCPNCEGTGLALRSPELPAYVGLNYAGPDPSVECAYAPCSNRLRRPEDGGEQWCSKAHREATHNASKAVGS